MHFEKLFIILICFGFCGCDYNYIDQESGCGDCADRECGTDNCGAFCGSCSDGYFCNADYICEFGSQEESQEESSSEEITDCVPDCSGKECGCDGCDGSCGSCDDSIRGTYCNLYACDFCPEGFLAFNNHCYKFMDFEMTYSEARNYCPWENYYDAHLVTISSPEENNFVSTLIGGTAWIGFNDLETEGVFRWITGEPVEYTNWASGEPNNQFGEEDCVNIGFLGSAWNDGKCATPNRFICEFEL